MIYSILGVFTAQKSYNGFYKSSTAIYAASVGERVMMNEMRMNALVAIDQRLTKVLN